MSRSCIRNRCLQKNCPRSSASRRRRKRKYLANCLNKSRPVALCPESSNSINSCRAKHLKLSQAERSEALPREARPPPKAAGAEGAPEPREGRKRKLGYDSTGLDSAVAYKHLASAGKRALHERDIVPYPEDVTDGFEKSCFSTGFIICFFLYICWI